MLFYMTKYVFKLLKESICLSNIDFEFHSFNSTLDEIQFVWLNYNLISLDTLTFFFHQRKFFFRKF